MVELLCTICLEHFDNLVHFGYMPCGHTACHGCLKTLLTGSKCCHYCRKSTRQYKPLPRVYLDVVSEHLTRPHDLTNNRDAGVEDPELDKILSHVAHVGPSSSTMTLERVGDELDSVLGNTDATVQTRLLTAMSDFRSRVQPCFKELDNLRDKLQKRKDDFAVLRSERDNLLKLVNTSASLAQEALEKKTSAEQQVERLRQERDEARQKCDEAQAGWRLAEKELTKVGDWDVLQAEVSQYKQASEQNKLSRNKYRAANQNLKAELEKLKASIERKPAERERIHEEATNHGYEPPLVELDDDDDESVNLISEQMPDRSRKRRRKDEQPLVDDFKDPINGPSTRKGFFGSAYPKPPMPSHLVGKGSRTLQRSTSQNVQGVRVDAKGRTLAAVQTGPKYTKRVK